MLFEVNIHSAQQFRPTNVPLVLILAHDIENCFYTCEIAFSNVYYMLILQKNYISLLLVRYFR